jgi:hypothetical protein
MASPTLVPYQGGLAPQSMASIYSQDPKKVVTTLNGQQYNFAGDPIKPSAPSAPPPTQTLPSLYGAGGGGQVYAPKLDIAAVSAKARAAAEGAVNPYYTKQLNDFLAQQAANRQHEQEQYQTNVTNLDDQFKNTQEQNALTQQRTAEDVAKNQADINLNTDQFQTDSGNQFAKDRLKIAQQASTGGLGAQQTEGAQFDRNTAEGRQAAKFQDARAQQDLFKSRTFADLAKSTEQAGIATDKSKKQAKFDLDTYIQNAGFDEQNQRNSLEQQRLEAVGKEQANQSKLLFNQYLSGITDPAKLQAAAQTYGGSF